MNENVQRGGNVKCFPERLLDFFETTLRHNLFSLVAFRSSLDAFWKNLVCGDYQIWRQDNVKLSHFIKGKIELLAVFLKDKGNSKAEDLNLLPMVISVYRHNE